MTKLPHSQSVEFIYVMASDPYRVRIYDRYVCKCPERTRMYKEFEEFCLRRDVLSYGWRAPESGECHSLWG